MNDVSLNARMVLKVALCSCVLISCFGSRTGLDTQDRRLPRCADASKDVEVVVQPAPGLAASSPVTRVTWWFRVTCNPIPPPYRSDVYEFSVRQNAGQLPEPIHGRFEVVPANEPFHFWLRGPATGYWCTNAEVQFADGTIRRIGPWLNNGAASSVQEIEILTSRQRGENQAAPVRLLNPDICLEAPR